MSYTNAELIRHHLVGAFPLAESIANQPLVFESDDYLSFFSGAVDQSTLKVKSVQSNDLVRTTVSLSSNPTSLTASPLAPGSVVVASDSSMGTVYVENSDYAVDYFSGTIVLKSGGSLGGGQTVTVWYLAFTLYSEGSDYQVKADGGEIRRLTGGDIAAGETVYLDYSPVHDSYNEDVLDNAVAEANSLVEREVDPDGEFGDVAGGRDLSRPRDSLPHLGGEGTLKSPRRGPNGSGLDETGRPIRRKQRSVAERIPSTGD
jgi:hypothetical protein